MITLRRDQFDGIEILRAAGHLDYRHCAEAKAVMSEVLEDSSSSVVLDLSDGQGVDSSWLGICIWFKKALGHQGRSMVIVSNASVDRILQLTRLDCAFRTVEVEEQALSMLLKDREVAL